MKTKIVLILSFLFISCYNLGVDLPEGAIPIKAPELYRQWWTELEECSGRKGNFDIIEWYIIPDVYSFYSTTSEHPNEPQKVAGMTYLNSHIIIVISGKQITNDMLVRHEMLHVLTNTVVHPPEVFGWSAPCSNIISHNM